MHKCKKLSSEKLFLSSHTVHTSHIFIVVLPNIQCRQRQQSFRGIPMASANVCHQLLRTRENIKCNINVDTVLKHFLTLHKWIWTSKSQRDNGWRKNKHLMPISVKSLRHVPKLFRQVRQVFQHAFGGFSGLLPVSTGLGKRSQWLKQMHDANQHCAFSWHHPQYRTKD